MQRYKNNKNAIKINQINFDFKNNIILINRMQNTMNTYKILTEN